mmetsp:Transcript_673/g.1216  ORF Transcript_673/g.1216 Transcript_673/m.1216 type:complete len:186 (+) Transcript_673:23-580(+)
MARRAKATALLLGLAFLAGLHSLAFLVGQPVPRAEARVRLAAEAETVVKAPSTEDASEPRRVLLVVSDANPYLSEPSKAALRYAANVGSDGHVTAMLLPVDEEHTNTTALQSTVQWWFNECGLTEEQFEELLPPAGAAPPAAIADAAEQLGSTEVVVPAEAVAKKRLDAPLLATFLGCPLVIVPE